MITFAGAEKGRITALIWKTGLQMDSNHDSWISILTSGTVWGLVKSGAHNWCSQLASAEATSRIQIVVSNF